LSIKKRGSEPTPSKDSTDKRGKRNLKRSVSIVPSAAPFIMKDCENNLGAIEEESGAT